MKFLIDAQLPPALAKWLIRAGHDAVALREIGLRDAQDHEICEFALANGYIIVTKDEDCLLDSEAVRSSDSMGSHGQHCESCAFGSFRCEMAGNSATSRISKCGRRIAVEFDRRAFRRACNLALCFKGLNAVLCP